MVYKKDGELKELVEKLKKGEITIKEVRGELKKLDLSHHGSGLNELILGLSIVVGLFFIYINTITRLFELEFLSYFSQFDTIDFPLIVKLFFTVILLFGLVMTFYASHLLSSKGGLRQGDDTIKFIREGPYKIMRPPIAFGMFCIFILPPIIISNYIDFTILAFIGQLILVLGMFIGPSGEDKINLRRWGEKYRQYMNEVPRFNFIKSLWNLRK